MDRWGRSVRGGGQWRILCQADCEFTIGYETVPVALSAVCRLAVASAAQFQAPKAVV